MASLNKVFLIGNLTRDVEVRYTPKGTPVTEIGLAINRTYQGDDGQKRTETAFLDVTVWGKQAESAAKYLSKGRSVFVEGRIQMDSWEDQQTGQKRIKLKVVAESLQFVDAHQVQNGTGVSQRQQRATPHKPASSPQDVSQQEWAETQRRSKAAAGSPEEDEPEDINFKTRIYKDVRQSPLNRRIF